MGSGLQLSLPCLFRAKQQQEKKKRLNKNNIKSSDEKWKGTSCHHFL